MALQFFFQVIIEDGKRIRKGITRKPDLVMGLARKKYLEIELQMLRKNIAIIQNALARYSDMSVDNILKLATHRYKACRKHFFQEQTGINSALTAEEEWSKEPYIQSEFMPERKIDTTSRGLMVRSKSEVMIAEKLYKYGVPFRYEQVITIRKYNIAPDYIARDKNGELWYWEHGGLTTNKKYMEQHKWKLGLYESAGIVPWRNLIVTYDDGDGTVNMKIIEAEMKNKLL